MYSHYTNGIFVPFVQPSHTCDAASGTVSNGLSKTLKNIGKQFSLENFDAGDILLTLIILFLLLEGDNLEMVITLGLMILLSMNDSSN